MSILSWLWLAVKLEIFFMNNYGNATQAKCQGLVWSYEPEQGLIQHPTATKANLFESRWTPNDHKTRNNFSLKETFFPNWRKLQETGWTFCNCLFNHWPLTYFSKKWFLLWQLEQMAAELSLWWSHRTHLQQKRSKFIFRACLLVVFKYLQPCH